jgi:hypothetical protein
MRRHSRWPLFFVVLLALATRAEAREYIPPFDLWSYTEQAELIVHGHLDSAGKLAVIETLKGKPSEDPLVIENPDIPFGDLQRAYQQPGAYEVVAYLRKVAAGKWAVEHGWIGIVGFQGQDVFLVHDQGQVLKSGYTRSKHPTWMRAAFLKDARDAIAVVEGRKTLLSHKPSAQRLRGLVQLLQRLPPAGQLHHLYEAARAIAPLQPEEERALVELLRRPDFPVEPALLLAIAGATAKGDLAFAAVSERLGRKEEPEVRHAAIEALARIDAYRAQEALIPVLDIDEPALRDALAAFSSSEPFRQNPAALEPLEKLTKRVRARHRYGDRQTMINESYALSGVLRYCAHPRQLDGLFEWALADDHGSARQALIYLEEATGLNYEDANGKPLKEPWRQWRERAKPAIDTRYDLTTTAGRSAWCKAYHDADADIRRLLMRLWAFEPKIDEAALMNDATAKETSEAAKAVLAEFWKHGRLSGDSKKGIVEKFVRVRLEEVPNQPASSRQLRVVGERDFPFPEQAWVHHRADIAIGERKPTFEASGSYSISSLGVAGPLTLGTRGGGVYPGTPEARALVEVREVTPSHQVIWRHQWELGPLQLRSDRE